MREHLASQFWHDRMAREALDDTDDIYPDDLMVIAVNILCVDADELLDLIVQGERAAFETTMTLRPQRERDVWAPSNSDIVSYVNGYYVVS